MTAVKISIAKISGPTLTHTVRRERLFTFLDERRGQPVTWVSAPGGSGKSTLVASYFEARKLPCIWYRCDEGDADLATFFYYMGLAAKTAAPRYKQPLPLLTPEYLAGIPTFTRRYFEILFSRCKTIVLDNYQDVPVAVPFHDMIATAFDGVPEGVRILVLSRGGPPASLARLQSHDKIQRLNGSDIRFTLEEATELAHARFPGLELNSIRTMHEKSEGWAAGIILMLERAKLDGPVIPETVDRVFDYLAAEIFDKTEPDIREFLLKTATLQTLSAPLAERLTGNAAAGRILSSLSRNNFFTERIHGDGQKYQYHSLFREFLLARAKERFSPIEHAQLLRDTASVLAESGEIEAAAVLFADAGAWHSLVPLILSHAGPLLAEGRSLTIEGWLRRLPNGVLAGSSHLLCLLGMCRMSSDLDESRSLLARAFDGFEADGDMNGAIAACSAIMDSFLAQASDLSAMGKWLDWLDRVEESGFRFPTREMELEAASRMLIATFHQPWHPRIGYWRRKAEELIVQEIAAPRLIAAGVAIILHYIFFGRMHQAALLLESLRPRLSAPGIGPFQRIHWQVAETIYGALASPSTAACHHEAAKGLALSRQSGIKVFDALFFGYDLVGGLISGEIAAVDRRQLETPEQMNADPNYRLLSRATSVWREMIAGEPAVAVERIRLAMTESEQLGAPQMTTWYLFAMALTQLQMEKREEAHRYLSQARSMAERMAAPLFDFSLLMADAWFAFTEGRETEGVELTGRAMRLGSEQGIMVLLLAPPAVLAGLCAKALEHGIEPKYAVALIRKHNLKPPASGSFLDAWPYPIKIHTLGRFQIHKDDEPLLFAGKIPKKQLELLKTLIAFGGRNVPVDNVTAALWPESDGDAAYASFKVALHSLRKLLGSDEVIVSAQGGISLNARHCRVDAQEFQRCADEVLKLWDTASKRDLQPLLLRAEKAIAMYSGNFLPGDTGMHAGSAMRERLRSRFVRLVELAGRQYGVQQQWHKAVELYEMGIDTDELQEDFYNGLMLCHRELGRQGAAAAVYERCRRMLHTNFNVAPSANMKALYTELVTPR